MFADPANPALPPRHSQNPEISPGDAPRRREIQKNGQNMSFWLKIAHIDQFENPNFGR
jgi:hypothetical protein